MKLAISNIDSVMSRLRKAVDTNLNAQFKEKVEERFLTLVQVSPQWSGDLASNWQISLDGSAHYSPTFKQQDWHKAQKVHMGDPAAVDYALAAAKLVEYTWKQKIYFANATPLTFGEKTVTGSGVTRVVRPENLIDGRVAMISYVRARYSK